MKTATLEQRARPAESLAREEAGNLYEGLTLKEKSQLNRRLRYSTAYRTTHS